MSSYLKILTLCVLFLAALSSHSQQSIVRFDRITNNDGLSSNQVNCIYQDRKGFIWFGTDDGLNRYDGSALSVYKHSIKNPTSLKDNYIDAVVEDNNGNLIVGTSKGLSVFDWATDQFTSLDFEEMPESLNNGNIESLLIDARNNLWVSVEGKGLFKLSLDDQNFSFYGTQEGLASSDVASVMIDENGIVWAVAAGKLHYFLYDHFERINFTNGPLRGAVITNFIQGSHDDFWLGTAGLGLFKIKNGTADGNELNGDVVRVLGGKENINEIQSIYRDRNGVIWTCVEGEGLIRIDGGDIQKYISSPQNPYSIGYNSILTIYQDKVGDLWFGTVAGGVSTIHFTKQNFRNISESAGKAGGLSAKDVTRISECRNGRIWIGTKTGGVNRFDPQGLQFDHFTENNSFIRNNSVEAVLGADDGSIWLGGWKSGLYQVTKDFELIRSFDLENSDLLSDNIFDLIEDKEGNIWVGTIGGGISRVAPDYQITSFLENDVIADESPIILALDSTDRVLLGGYRGLTIFNPTDESSKRYFFKEDLSGISSNTIQCMWVVSTDSIWIGTDDGLNLFNPEKGTFNHYFEEDGLPSNSIKGIVLEKQNLWVSTSNGLSKFDLNSGTFRNFSQLDGVQGRQFTSNSFLKSTRGNIYLGGVNGVTSFSPHDLLLNERPPDVMLTDLKVNSISIQEREGPPLTKHVSELEEIKLEHHESYIAVSFVALNFISSENNQFAYMLEGFDKDWVYTNNPTAFYSNINPGTYTFKAKASNNNGVWNEQGASLGILILNPWWSSWWFRSLYITVALVSVYLFFWLRTKRLRHQKLMLKNTVSERTRQLEDQKEELEETLENLKKAQMQVVQSEKMASLGVLTAGIAHEINNPLQFIRGGKEIIEKELLKSGATENKLIQKSLSSIEEGVQRTGAILQSLNRFNRKPKEEMEMCDMHSILENCVLMLNNEHQGRIEVERNYQDHLVVAGNEGELHQVFLNILKNAGQAIKEHGTIKIETLLLQEGKKVTITDTGKGMDQETITKVIEPFFTTMDPGKGPGLGLAIGYQIIKKHNGDISFESAPDEGTTVSVTFFD